MPWSAVAGAVVSVVGNHLLNGSSGEQQTSTQQQQLDPRIAAILFGSGEKTLKPGAKPSGTDDSGNPIYTDSDYEPAKPGLLARYQGLLDQPQISGLKHFNEYNNNYLNNDLPYDMGQQRNTAWALATSDGIAPQMQAARSNYTTPLGVAQSAFPGGVQGPQTYNAQTANVNLINAPGQNDLNLNPAYHDVIYGQLGNNPYLAEAIQKGLNQSSAQFQDLQSDTMRQFKEDILPSLRGDAIAHGQYGGSRQGLAEGKAADALTRNMSRALSQVAQNQTDAAVQAQAQAYGQDRQNQLNAMSGLSGQQYGVAGSNAAAQNQVGLSNAQMMNQAGQFNAGAGNNYLAQMLQNNQFNASAINNANGMQYQGNQQMNLANLNNQQAANQYNANALFNMAQLNSQNKATGVGLLANLANQQYAFANNQNDYDINRAAKVNSLLAPYMGLNGSTVSSAPMYQNTGSNLLGGAMAGAQLFKQFNNGSGSGNNPYNEYNRYSGGNDGWTLPNGESIGT